MITFEEFLSQYSEKIREIYDGTEMSKNAKIAVVSTMRRYLGNKRFDPVSLLNLFESVCTASMTMGSVDEPSARRRFATDGKNYLIGERDFFAPGMSFAEVEDRARGK